MIIFISRLPPLGRMILSSFPLFTCIFSRCTSPIYCLGLAHMAFVTHLYHFTIWHHHVSSFNLRFLVIATHVMSRAEMNRSQGRVLLSPAGMGHKLERAHENCEEINGRTGQR